MNDETSSHDDGRPLPFRAPSVGRDLDRLRAALGRIEDRGEALLRGAGSAGGDRAPLETALAAAGMGWWEIAPRSGGSFWDDGMRRLFGVGAEDPVGPGVALARMPTEDRDAFEVALRAAADPAGSGVFQVDYRIEGTAEAPERWIWSRGRAFFEAGACVRLVGVAEDISARKRAERAACDGSERLALAVDAAEIGIWSAGPSLADFRWDDRVRALFGLRPGVPIDPVSSLGAINEGDRAAVDLAIRDAFDPAGDGHYDIVFRAIGIDDGIERTLRAKGRVRSDGGGPARLLGAVRDVSAERRAETVLAEAAATLERRVAERTASLERASVALARSQKMEAVGQLTGAVAHDFNNILTGIGASLELLDNRLRQGRFEDAERLIARAQGAVGRAASLTGRMLAFSRIRPQETRTVDLNAALELFAVFLRQTAGPFVSLDVSLDPAHPHSVLDPDLLRAALLSLVQNAREAMPDGGSVRLATGSAFLDATAPEAHLRPGRYATLSVRDDGIGMTEPVALRAFDPFFTTKPLGQEAGLGLSIVHGFARQSDGVARMETEPGRGTTVTMFLPLALPGAGPAAWPGPAVTGDGTYAARRTVLVVEDDEVLRPVVAEVLAELGYASLRAGNGAAGLRMLAGGAPIDLVISDLGLPGALDGRVMVEAGRRMRPDLKAIFIAGGDDAAVAAAGHDGAAVLRKPFTMRELADLIVASLGDPD